MATIYNINFDFTSQEQQLLLRQLQAGNYTLFGFKGASGPNQITTGLPVWFTIPYMSMFGRTQIDYQPQYKVYVYNQDYIGTNITIHMQALSAEVPLGTILTFNADGTFSIKPGGSAGASNVTAGLAAKINGVYAPFCAFTSRPQGVVVMQPNDKIALFAAQTYLFSGSIISNALNPGCTFEFNPGSIQYNLEMMPASFSITNIPAALPVTEMYPGASLIQLLNSQTLGGY
ncbi:hypothetical protein [uncultured Psychroserpens sp.]|uniref:hypothetical protein n=1 Tax=uncultured Psychroserpens sp. TaxID=255436 RepID=UPI0026381C2D|nr:hypothetical protein [uncultured Psychroserpens sp.]